MPHSEKDQTPLNLCQYPKESAAIDQSPGIRAIHGQLCVRYGGDWVRAEHDMMDALAETQRDRKSVV